MGLKSSLGDSNELIMMCGGVDLYLEFRMPVGRTNLGVQYFLDWKFMINI